MPVHSSSRHRRRVPGTIAGCVHLFLLALLLAPLASASQLSTPDPGHHHGPSHEREATAEEQAAAERLVAATRAAVTRYEDFAVAEAEGYRPVTPFAFYGARAAHFQRDDYLTDRSVLDPERPEQLIYLKADDGQLALVGVMYLARIGQGLAVGGPLTHWHTHDDLCANWTGMVPTLVDGSCLAGTFPLAVEMLHIWLIDHPDGPFAEKPPVSIVSVTTPWDDTGGSLAAAASLLDWPALLEALGAVLGLSPEEVAERMDGGESLVEMAEGQGVPRADLEQVVLDQFARAYDRAVANGDMTPDQRALLERALPEVIHRAVELHRGDPWIPTGD
jgi:hypothetical protein